MFFILQFLARDTIILLMKLTVDTDKLNKHMTYSGLTQRDVAEKIGMSRQTISKVLIGKASEPRTIKKIAEALGLKVEDAWGRAGNRVSDNKWTPMYAQPTPTVDRLICQGHEAFLNSREPTRLVTIQDAKDWRAMGRNFVCDVCNFKSTSSWSSAWMRQY